MSKRAVGVSFCTLAALLYISRYYYTAIFFQGISRNDGFYERWLDFLGTGPTFWATTCIIVGIFYLIWAEFEEKINNFATSIVNKIKKLFSDC
ncbi:hypothetical protein [Brevibacillus sp. NRS-1366]|uniref:hypothetical protein n=1 Tax=Brevibacillus sp. NRS-1366 TaxID=3233899 RepID=UPI003D2133EA